MGNARIVSTWQRQEESPHSRGLWGARGPAVSPPSSRATNQGGDASAVSAELLPSALGLRSVYLQHSLKRRLSTRNTNELFFLSPSSLPLVQLSCHLLLKPTKKHLQ